MVSPKIFGSAELILFVMILFISQNVFSRDPHTSLSLQGYSGLLNTPNAAQISHGSVSAQYSDLVFHKNEYTHNNNLTTAIGILPFVEVGGRIAWFDTQSNCYISGCSLRDLSANVKISLPFLPSDLFSLSVGQQDIGGAANHFDTRFLVASKVLKNTRVSMGWGQQIKKQTINRLEGLFGGIEIQALPWLNLIAEHDGESANLGAKLVSPKNQLPFGVTFSATALLYQDSKDLPQKQFYGLSLNLPLGRQHDPSAKIPRPSTDPERIETKKPRTETKHLDAIKRPSLNGHQKSRPAVNGENNRLLALLHRLENTGFERISVGEIASHSGSSELAIQLENTAFNVNELDAVASVLKTANEAVAGQYQYLTLLLTKQGINTYWIKVPLALQTGLNKHESSLGGGISSGFGANLPHINWKYRDLRVQRFKPRVTLSPSLSSAVATEFGVWDYSLALEAMTSISLWKGAIATTSYTQSFNQSEDFEENGVFYNNRQLSAFKNYGLQQILKVNNQFYSSFFVGLSAYDYRSIINETSYFTRDGRHRFNLLAGVYKNIYETDISKKSYLASYRYYLPYYDLSSTLTVGQFWEQDQGLRIDLKYWFADTAISLFYKDTDSTFVGMGLSIPLSPKKSFNSAWGQVKGANSWHYALQTRIGNSRNNVSFRSALLAPLPLSLNETMFNEDRLNPLYIQKNTTRIYEHHR